MPEKKQKNDTTSLRMPQPKKLGLAVPPLLRLPHEELIRAPEDRDESTQASSSKDSPSLPETGERLIDAGSTGQVNNENPGDPTRHADSASLANLDGAKSASRARTAALGQQIASLANPAAGVRGGGGTGGGGGGTGGVGGGGGGGRPAGAGGGTGRGIGMDDAVGRAASHVGDGGIMETTGGGKNFQFRRTFTNGNGQTETRIGRFDVNPADPHVQKHGPHLNLEVQINGRVQSNRHIPINPGTVRPGDHP